MTGVGLNATNSVNSVRLCGGLLSPTQSTPSPTSSTDAASIFSNGDARSSQSSAPSSVKASPLEYETEIPSENETSDLSSTGDSVNDELGEEFRHASLRTCSPTNVIVRPELRRHPRRTCNKSDRPTLKHEDAATRAPPSLVRQCDRKEQFVEALVDTTTEMIEVIWPFSVAQCSLPQSGKHILDLRKFVQEVLRRSKTSYSTLQVALFYLVLILPFIPRPQVPECRDEAPVCRALRCGRRMFLAALILASKYLQDRNYTMSAWAKISGLKKEEICFNELAFLRTVNYDLHIPEPRFKEWAELVLKYSLQDECRVARTLNGGKCESWRSLVPRLTKDLAFANDPEAPPVWAHVPPQRFQSCQSIPSSRSNSPTSAVSFIKPPSLQPLEPTINVAPSLPYFPTSPKPPKLATPCLPPINADCTPAVSRCQFSGPARASSMGLALQKAAATSMNRASIDGWPATQQTMAMSCPRRSCLAQSSTASSPVIASTLQQRFNESLPEVDHDCNRPNPTGSSHACVVTAIPSRHSHSGFHVSSSSSLEEDTPDTDDFFAARALQTLSRGNTCYSTPISMCSMTSGSSSSSSSSRASITSTDLDAELATPKAIDNTGCPLARTARKRERQVSRCEDETELSMLMCMGNVGKIAADSTLCQSPQILSSPDESSGAGELELRLGLGMVKHAGGVMVDYGAGVEDMCVRSSRRGHMRSASGSRNGMRKRNCGQSRIGSVR